MQKQIVSFLAAATLLLCINHSAHAKDNFGFPDLKTPSNAAVLKVAFANTEQWDGRNFMKEMRCTALGGKNPVSPVLNIGTVPAEATSLVVFYANPRSRDSHGLIRFRKDKNDAEWQIPAIKSQASDKLPQGVELYDGGNLAGKAYAAPCPTSGNWQYTATVYALNEADAVIAVGKLVLGFVAP